MPVAVKSSRFFLCTSLYTAKKSYFALSSLSEFLRVSAGCSKKQPVFFTSPPEGEVDTKCRVRGIIKYLYTSLKNSVASTHAIRVSESYTGCSKKQPVFFTSPPEGEVDTKCRVRGIIKYLYTSLKNSVASTHAIRVSES